MADLTTNVIPKATGATQVDDSIIIDNDAAAIFSVTGRIAAGDKAGQRISMVGGADSTTGNGGGRIQLKGGDDTGGAGGAGDAHLTGGTDSGGGGGAGDASVEGGVSLADGVPGGEGGVFGGSAFTGNANGGNVVLDGGYKHGTGKNGQPVIGATPVAVADLPTSPIVGMFATVNDAMTPAVGLPVANGGAASAVVAYGGTQWTVVSI